MPTRRQAIAAAAAMASSTSRPSASDCVSPIRLLIFAARRTGSSYLVDLLRRHPSILMHGELFHTPNVRDAEDGYAGREYPPEAVFNVRRKNPAGLLRYVQCHAEGHRVVGLKVFRDHVRTTNWHHLTAWCTVCVVLKRDDVNAQHRSLLVAQRTGRWKGPTSRAITVPSNRSGDFDGWKWNQDLWYRTVSERLAKRALSQRLARRDNISVVPLRFETHLVGKGGPDLSPLWKALGLEPPPATSPERGKRRGARLSGRL